MSTLDEVTKILLEINTNTSPAEYNKTESGINEIMTALLDRSLDERSSSNENEDEKIVDNNAPPDDGYSLIHEELLKNATNVYYTPIHSNRKLIGGLILLFKKVVRRILKGLLQPMIDRQNAFNTFVIHALDINHRNNELNRLSLIRRSNEQIHTNIALLNKLYEFRADAHDVIEEAEALSNKIDQKITELKDS